MNPTFTRINSVFRKKIFILAISVTAITVFLPLSGCGVLSFSSTTVHSSSFVKGELTSKIGKNLETVWKAVQKVAEQSQFQIKSSRADAFSAVLKCEDAQLRKIEITLEKEDPALTRVKIRVGLLGDAELSTQIFEQIRQSVEK